MLDIMADDEVLCENSDKIIPMEYQISNAVLDLSLKPILNSRFVVHRDTYLYIIYYKI